jgi:hypothetical protein
VKSSSSPSVSNRIGSGVDHEQRGSLQEVTSHLYIVDDKFQSELDRQCLEWMLEKGTYIRQEGRPLRLGVHETQSFARGLCCKGSVCRHSDQIMQQVRSGGEAQVPTHVSNCSCNLPIRIVILPARAKVYSKLLSIKE